MTKEVFLRPLPPGALVLMTPWQNDGNGEYVGLPADPMLIQITELAELDGSVPRISDCFLSWHSAKVFADAPHNEAISEDHSSQHTHKVVHTHSAKIRGSGFEGSTRIDDNDSGDPLYFASGNHEHDIEVERDSVNLTEESRQLTFDPLHYEVAAFWVDDQGQSVAAPAGMIAFRDDNMDSAPGWQRMDLETLRRDPREPDPTYGPRHWREEAFKVVGCTPSKHRKGARDHLHDVPLHDHRQAGTVYSSTGANPADDSSGGTGVAGNGHRHSVTSISPAKGSLTSAPNLRRHKKTTVWVAREDGVEIPEGMLVPYIPKDQQMLDDLVLFGPDAWRPAYEQSASKIDPVFVTAGDYVTGSDEPGRIYGSNLHTHKLTHSHQIKVSTTDSTSTRDGDRDIVVAHSNHQHDTIFVEQTDESSEMINPLRYRRVMFIRKT